MHTLFHISKISVTSYMLLLACSLPTDPIGGEVIASRIRVSVVDDLTTPERTVGLLLETEEEYNEMIIKADAERSGRKFIIRIRALEPEPEYGVIGVGEPLPAWTVVNLGPLETGCYLLEFRMLHPFEFNGLPGIIRLTVTDECYSLSESSGFLIYPDPQLIRPLPPDVLWGHILTGSRFIWESFLDSLRTVGVTPAEMAEGDYGSYLETSHGPRTSTFIITPNQELIPTSRFRYPRDSPGYFILHYRDSISPFLSVLRSYVNTYGQYRQGKWHPALHVTFHTSSGEYYESWNLVTRGAR